MLNKVILMGRLTKDPELRVTNSGVSVATFSVAVDTGHGENKTTDFINCVAWRNTAEFVSKYFTKGQMIIVLGRISTRDYEDKNGNKKYITEVIANEVQFGESKKADKELTEDEFTPLDIDDDIPFK